MKQSLPPTSFFSNLSIVSQLLEVHRIMPVPDACRSLSGKQDHKLMLELTLEYPSATLQCPSKGAQQRLVFFGMLSFQRQRGWSTDSLNIHICMRPDNHAYWLSYLLATSTPP